ncbi:unnamed protein product [Sympodiomycopsis kandeliae]
MNARPNVAEAMRDKESNSKEKLLSAAEVGLVNKRAQINASITGIVSAVAAGFGASRIMKLSPNVSLLTGVLTGSFIAYIEARTELARGMTALAYSHRLRTGHDPTGIATPLDSLGNDLDLKASQETRFEAGVGGMHEFMDEKATTRGDH